MKKILKFKSILLFFLVGASVLFMSCSEDDEPKIEVGKKTLITKTELEKITSFQCDDQGNQIFLKFRNGHIYKKEITKYGYTCNVDDIIYTLVGNRITMEMDWQKTTGTIYKVKGNDGLITIEMQFDGTYGIATWLSKTFKQSSYVF